MKDRVDRQRRRASHRAHWARLQRLALHLHTILVHKLGGKCARCEGDETTPLTIDHIAGCRMWNLRALNPYRRVLRYLAEDASGVPLRVLCLQCNSEERNTRRLPEAPF